MKSDPEQSMQLLKNELEAEKAEHEKTKGYLKSLRESELEAVRLLVRWNALYNELSVMHKDWLDKTEIFTRDLAATLGVKPFFKDILRAVESTRRCRPEDKIKDTHEYLIEYREWPPEQSLMDQMTEVVGFTSLRIDLKPGFRAFCREATIRASDVYDAIQQRVFDEDEHGILYFVDQYPEANWGHECVYILVLVP